MPYVRARLAVAAAKGQPVRPRGERGDCERRRGPHLGSRPFVGEASGRTNEARCAKRRELCSASLSCCYLDCCIIQSLAKSVSGRRLAPHQRPTPDPCPTPDLSPTPDLCPIPDPRPSLGQHQQCRDPRVSLAHQMSSLQNLKRYLPLAGSGTCRTVGGAAGRGKTCVFPFEYENRVYRGCPVDLEDREVCESIFQFTKRKLKQTRVITVSCVSSSAGTIPQNQES